MERDSSMWCALGRKGQKWAKEKEKGVHVALRRKVLRFEDRCTGKERDTKLGCAGVKCWLRRYRQGMWKCSFVLLPDDGSSTPIHTTRTHKPHGTWSQRCDSTYLWKRKKKRATEEKIKSINRTEQNGCNRTVLGVLTMPPVDGTSVKTAELPMSLMFELGTWQVGRGICSAIYFSKDLKCGIFFLNWEWESVFLWISS